MKTCDNCGSVTFDDMEMCFDCMSSFSDLLDKNEIEEAQTAARLQVVLAGFFCYEMLLQKLDGCSLSIGSAPENAIVLPLEQVATHLLEVFFAHGHVWAESSDSSAQATVDEIPLFGTVLIQPGTQINIGEATITLVEV